MQNINIKKQEKSGNLWKFSVEVGEKDDRIKYSVEIEEEYWEKLTEKKIGPRELVKKSFEFLLKREPKESILKKFNLREISKYFPEYEEEIKKYGKTS